MTQEAQISLLGSSSQTLEKSLLCILILVWILKLWGKPQNATVLKSFSDSYRKLSSSFVFPHICDYFFSVNDSQLFYYTLPGNLFTFSNGSLYLSSYWLCPEKMTLGMYRLTREVTFSKLQDSLTWILFSEKNMFSLEKPTNQPTHPTPKQQPPLYLLGWAKRKLQHTSSIPYSGVKCRFS